MILYAILLGMAFNVFDDDPKCTAGVGLPCKKVLQLGVVLVGAAVTLGGLIDVSANLPDGCGG